MTKNFSYLTHPIVLAALLLTAVNDHYLKYQFHNFLTGKISDFSGLFFFPLFLFALIEFVKSPQSLHTQIKKMQLIISIIITDALFVLFKYTFLRDYLVEILNIRIVPDVTDLVAMSMNWVTYFFASKYFIEPELK